MLHRQQTKCILAYPAMLVVTMPNKEQRTFTDPREAMLCLEDQDQGDLPQQQQQKQTPNRQDTPGKQQRINRQAYYTPKRAKQRKQSRF